MNLSIIFEDENILVVNKPSGLVVHPFDFSNEETLLDQIQNYLGQFPSFQALKNLQDGREINLGGLVHKLDRETSGVLVYAKTKTVYEELAVQFKNHTVQKMYEAFVEGVIHEDNLVINAPLGREKKSFKQTVNPEHYRGELREALTEVQVIERYEHATFVRLFPKTGRTHQLRAHMSYINHPIVGDAIYGNEEGNEKTGRMFLHAKEITITLKGISETFTATYEEDFVCPQLGSNQRPAD